MVKQQGVSKIGQLCFVKMMEKKKKLPIPSQSQIIKFVTTKLIPFNKIYL